ncbi:hypothetical protein [Herpetosiphon giganteus]|uniref:hypothetical protein n=1 Tax=Herpetosiphon giganteus TaxID=2029754 RepID=UPI001959D4A5|nr:hypothetical protein [Herpetosiphon giganteus]MBM7841593.1 hypothetical protein [Herpetosiphon giganteus]
MHYEYDPWYFAETKQRNAAIVLWQVTQNPGKLFYAQIEAFEKIFRQASGFYDTKADIILLTEPANLKALIEAMLAYWGSAYPLTPLMFNLPIQMLLVLYRRAIGEWLPAPAALMDTIEGVADAMTGWEHA